MSKGTKHIFRLSKLLIQTLYCLKAVLPRYLQFFLRNKTWLKIGIISVILLVAFFCISSIQGSKPNYFTVQESKLAHKLLDGLKGIEVGAAAHNPFGLNTTNVDFTFRLTMFKMLEKKNAGTIDKVKAITYGDCLCLLPFPDKSQDFVISSHVITLFYDPVSAIKEWLRVVRNGGYVFILSPHKDRIGPFKHNNRTTLHELIKRHKWRKPINWSEHFTYWITEDLVELCNYYNWTIVAKQDSDDKIGDGFTIVIQKDLK